MSAVGLSILVVMPVFAGIHDLETLSLRDVVDARDKPGHDVEGVI